METDVHRFFMCMFPLEHKHICLRSLRDIAGRRVEDTEIMAKDGLRARTEQSE